MKSFIKCFSQEKADQLKQSGFNFVHESNGVFLFEYTEQLITKFSKNDSVFNDTKITSTVNF